jgi:hypothetical protein
MLRRVIWQIVTDVSETCAKFSAVSKIDTFFRLKELEVEAKLFLLSFSKGGDETESSRYIDHCLDHCTSPGWWMMSVEQSVG